MAISSQGASQPSSRGTYLSKAPLATYNTQGGSAFSRARLSPHHVPLRSLRAHEGGSALRHSQTRQLGTKDYLRGDPVPKLGPFSRDPIPIRSASKRPFAQTLGSTRQERLRVPIYSKPVRVELKEDTANESFLSSIRKRASSLLSSFIGTTGKETTPRQVIVRQPVVEPQAQDIDFSEAHLGNGSHADERVLAKYGGPVQINKVDSINLYSAATWRNPMSAPNDESMGSNLSRQKPGQQLFGSRAPVVERSRLAVPSADESRAFSTKGGLAGSKRSYLERHAREEIGDLSRIKENSRTLNEQEILSGVDEVEALSQPVAQLSAKRQHVSEKFEQQAEAEHTKLIKTISEVL